MALCSGAGKNRRMIGCCYIGVVVADGKAYDPQGFVNELRSMKVTLHVT